MIYVQIGPKLQHLVSYNLPYCKDFFETLWHKGAQLVDNSRISQLSQKIPFSSKRTICVQFRPKVFNLISHDLSQNCYFWKHFSIMRRNRLAKVTLVSFPQKSSFNTIVQFDPNFGKNYVTLCPRELCLLIHSLKILKCGMIEYNSYTKVILVNLPKKLPLGARTIWAKFGTKLCNLVSWFTLWGCFWISVPWWGTIDRQKQP